MSLFINRTEELEFLESEYSRDSSSLVVIYGRRRVGKTELVLKFMAGKPSVYYLSQKLDLEHQVEDFLEKTSELFMETSHSAEIMHNAWKEPVPADEALEILSLVGGDLDVFYDLLMDQVLTTKL
nr:ATP-binding protein [uncultured Methanolobus sp.]